MALQTHQLTVEMATRRTAQAQEALNQDSPTLLVSKPEPPRSVPATCTIPAVAEAWDHLAQTVRENMPNANLDYIRQAFEFSAESHNGDKRKSGEPYVIHPLEVAQILAEMSLDQETIAAALLHDVVEDCGITREEIEEEFGQRVGRLVDSVTKLGRIPWTGDD